MLDSNRSTDQGQPLSQQPLEAALGNIANIATTSEGGRWLRFWLQAAARDLLPDEKIAQCLRRPVPLATLIDIMHSPSRRSAFYRKLITCDSVWMCPVCAAKITEQRRLDLQHALDITDLRPVLITYTLKHALNQPLLDSLSAVTEANRLMRKSGGWVRLTKAFGWVGSIRSIEVTHTEANGWHPHIHELVLLPAGTKDSALLRLEALIRKRWLAALPEFGFSASWSHGVVLQEADRDVRDYVVKWGIAGELTKLPVKRASPGGRTPMELLTYAALGDRRAARLWQEYATSFKGRHQLQWSRGLRSRLGLNEDEPNAHELVAAEPDDTVLLASLTLDQWRLVLLHNKRAEVLNVASSGSFSKLAQFLDAIGIDLYI